MGSYPKWLQPPAPQVQGRTYRHDQDGIYEQLKALWIANHPDATPAEYEAAIRVIAQTAGT